MDNRLLCIILSAVSLFIGGCKDSNRTLWDGTWALNGSKSQAYGSYFTVVIDSNSVVTVVNEAYSFRFQCNNKEFENGEGHTIICASISGNQWRLTRRSNGKDSGTSIWNISADGKTLTIHSSEVRSNETQGLHETEFMRRSGTRGFAGRWQDKAPFRSRPSILNVALDGHRLHLAYPSIGQYSDSPLDGTSVPVHGPRVRPGTAIVVRLIDPREFSTRLTFSGQVIREGTLGVSEDGRTLLQESWDPKNPDEKDHLVYDKQ